MSYSPLATATFIWRRSDAAIKVGLCYLCGRVFNPGDEIAFFSIPGPRGWDKGHVQCALDDSRVINKPSASLPVEPEAILIPAREPKKNNGHSSTARIVTEEHASRGSPRYHVFVGNDKLYSECSKERAEGAKSALNIWFSKA
jgi:hypothetical protein